MNPDNHYYLLADRGQSNNFGYNHYKEKNLFAKKSYYQFYNDPQQRYAYENDYSEDAEEKDSSSDHESDSSEEEESEQFNYEESDNDFLDGDLDGSS